MAGGAAAAAGGLLGLEFCLPSLLLCWFCCWDDNASESSSTEGRPPQSPIVTTDVLRHSRGSKEFRRRTGSSACSLRLPSHSRDNPVQESHRSHEELRGAPSRLVAGVGGERGEGGEGRSLHYHSAPSVLREVLHRRDWDTQLHPRDADFIIIPLTDTPRLSHDELEAARTCKKHYTNIKSSKKKLSKEDSRNQDPKDLEEPPTYIDDNVESPSTTERNIIVNPIIEKEINVDEASTDINNDIIINRQISKTQFKAKEAKQSYNESIKHRNSTKIKRNSEIYDHEAGSSKASEGMDLSLLGMEISVMNDGADVIGDVEVMSMRSGAMHHGSKDSLATCHSKMDYPRASVEAVSYSVAACYLQSPPPSARGEAGGGGRGRLASDGDILQTSHRPHSTAFSESDLELELEISASIERPPPYCHTQERDTVSPPAKRTTTRRKETAI